MSTREVRLAELPAWVSNLLASRPPHVWLLSGPLGAGKTTLVQAVGAALQVRGDITSPTFSLQKIHPLVGQPWKQLVHLDAYRIKDVREVAALELDEHVSNPASLVVVEWPERLPGFPWGRHLAITLASGRRADQRRLEVRTI